MRNILLVCCALAFCLGCCTRLPPHIQDIKTNPSDKDDRRAIGLVQKILRLPDPAPDIPHQLFSYENDIHESLITEIKNKAGPGTIKYLFDVAARCFDRKPYYLYGPRNLVADKQTLRMFACLHCLETSDELISRAIFEEAKQQLLNIDISGYKWFLSCWIFNMYPPHKTFPILADSLNDRRACHPKITRLMWVISDLIYVPKNRVCDFVYREMRFWLALPHEDEYLLDRETYDRRLYLFREWWKTNEARLLEKPDILDYRYKPISDRLLTKDAFHEWLGLPEELVETPLVYGGTSQKISQALLAWRLKYEDTPLEQIPLPDVDGVLGVSAEE